MWLFVKNLLFTLLIPGTVGVYLPLRLAQWRGRSPTGGWLAVVGGAAFCIGGAIYAWCLWDFARFGRGTPAPIDAPKRLVARGLYRYTRNPMYIAVLSGIGGWAALFHEPFLLLYGLLVGLLFHLFVVAYEEPHLRARFGAEYEAFCARVPRWLPRPKRNGAE